jgi:hypothetical protein
MAGPGELVHATPAYAAFDWTPQSAAFAAAFSAVLVGIAVGCAYGLVGPVDALIWGLGVAIIAACAAVGVHQILVGQAFAPSAIYAYLFALHFGLPALIVAAGQYEWENEVNRQYLVPALLYVAIAWLAFQVGHRLAGEAMPALRARAGEAVPVFEWSAIRVVWACIALAVVGFAIRFYIIRSDAYFQVTRGQQGELEGPLFALVRMIELFPMYALCIAAIARWSPIGDRGLTRLFWVLLALEALYWIPTGRKEQSILAFLLPLIVRYLMTGRFLKLPGILAAAAALAVFFPVIHYYRVGLELGVFASGDIIGTLSAGASLLEDSASQSDLSPFEVVLNRLSLIESVTACVRLIDSAEWAPFYGQSYADLVVGLVPRVLWPDKPGFHYGTEFGRAAGFIGGDDWLTSISVTFPGEAFLNFGWGGVAAMGVIGAVFGVLYRMHRISRRPRAWLLLYVIALPSVLYVGGTFALHFGGLAKLLPALFLLAVLLQAPPSSRIGGTRS